MVAVAAAAPSEVAAVAASVVFGPRRLRAFSDDARADDLNTVAALVESGVLRPVVGPRFCLDSVADAHRSLSAGGCTGKRVVDVSSDTTASRSSGIDIEPRSWPEGNSPANSSIGA